VTVSPALGMRALGLEEHHADDGLAEVFYWPKNDTPIFAL
jgi:hypothetical protein